MRDASQHFFPARFRRFPGELKAPNPWSCENSTPDLPNLAEVAKHVLQGHGDIAKRLGMSDNGLDAQLDALADLARKRFAVQPPGPSAAADGPWVLHHSGWDITVGRVRKSFRIMSFAPGGAAWAASQPPQSWLDQLLAPAALQPAAAERLLWVAMAWTNGWVQH